MSTCAVLFELDNTLYPYAPADDTALRAVHDRLARDADEGSFNPLYPVDPLGSMQPMNV